MPSVTDVRDTLSRLIYRDYPGWLRDINVRTARPQSTRSRAVTGTCWSQVRRSTRYVITPCRLSVVWFNNGSRNFTVAVTFSFVSFTSYCILSLLCVCRVDVNNVGRSADWFTDTRCPVSVCLSVRLSHARVVRISLNAASGNEFNFLESLNSIILM